MTEINNAALRRRIEELQQQIAERDRELEPPPRRVAGGYATARDALRAEELKRVEMNDWLFGPADDRDSSHDHPSTDSPGDWGGAATGGTADTRPLDERADAWLRSEFDKQHGRNTR
jgi:hypothetical protein